MTPRSTSPAETADHPRGAPSTPQRDVFAALGDPVRRQLLELIAQSGPVSATALAGRVAISRQGVTKHLDVLRGAELIARQRTGRETLYTATLAPLDDVLTWIGHAEQQWDDRLDRLAAKIESKK